MVEIAGVTGQKFEEAEWWWQSADALRRRTGADASDEGGLIALRATLKQLRGEYDEALALSDQALALIESPRLRLKVMNDRGDLFSRMGRFDDADAAFADAHAKSVEMRGAKHPDTALPLANRGMIALQREDYPRAVALIEQAIEVLEPAVAPGNPHLASMHNMLGVAAENQEQYAEARKQYARALAIREQALGPEHSEVAMIHGNLGRLAWAEGHNEEAIEEFRQSVAIFERTLGPEHPTLGNALSGLGTTYFELQRFDEAIPPLERAVAILSRNDVDPFLLARTQFLLARVLWDHGDRKRAAGLARQAHTMLVKPEAPSEPRNAIAAWSEKIGLDLEGDAQ
jgi:tetratricopeptide (TPR) repeat protein